MISIKRATNPIQQPIKVQEQSIRFTNIKNKSLNQSQNLNILKNDNRASSEDPFKIVGSHKALILNTTTSVNQSLEDMEVSKINNDQMNQRSTKKKNVQILLNDESLILPKITIDSAKIRKPLNFKLPQTTRDNRKSQSLGKENIKIKSKFNHSTHRQQPDDDSGNYFHGFTARQFVEEVDRQVNLKEIVASAKAEHHYMKAPRIESGLTSHLSMQSNITTITDRVKTLVAKTPIKIKGLGFTESPYNRMLQQEQRTLPQKKKDFTSGIVRNQKFLEIVHNKKQKEQRLYKQLEQNLSTLVQEHDNYKSDDKRLELTIAGIDDHEKYYQERINELNQQVNISELNTILKGITQLHNKKQDELLPNIGTGKRFHYSYAKLNLRGEQ